MYSDKYDKIFEHNKEWVDNHTQEDKSFMKKLHKGQEPDFLYIGCSDSRVPANKITGLDFGDLFVHRNIANIIPEGDSNSLSVINYAVEHLHVKHIVVCGHYGCGGVHAAMAPHSHGLLDDWLDNIKEIYSKNEKELSVIDDEEDMLDRLTELNVVEQCKHIASLDFVKESYKKTGYPIIHGWMYDMKDGKLTDSKRKYQ